MSAGHHRGSRVLVTGMSGAGKSTLLTELAHRGHQVVDTDYDNWTRPDGTWDEPRMTALLAGPDQVVVAGTVANQGRFYDRFDHVILLSAPLDVLLDRVTRRSNNPYGQTSEHRTEIRRYVHEVEPLLRRSATRELDGRLPVPALADTVEQLLTTSPAVGVPEVWLVRHAWPEVVAEADPRQWQLSADGLASARRLRGLLPAGAVLVASDEIKAVQTLQQACEITTVRTDAGFGEVRRPHEWVDDHRERARAYLDGTTPAGWEPPEQVAQRFSAAVDRHRTPDQPLIVATHGMACSVWLARQIPLDAGEFWSGLRFPDVIVVDLEAGTAQRATAN